VVAVKVPSGYRYSLTKHAGLTNALSACHHLRTPHRVTEAVSRRTGEPSAKAAHSQLSPMRPIGTSPPSLSKRSLPKSQHTPEKDWFSAAVPADQPGVPSFARSLMPTLAGCRSSKGTVEQLAGEATNSRMCGYWSPRRISAVPFSA
jgi:hypothetical protein